MPCAYTVLFCTVLTLAQAKRKSSFLHRGIFSYEEGPSLNFKSLRWGSILPEDT